MRKIRVGFLTTVVPVLAPARLFAHEAGVATVGSLLPGLLHPILSLDYLLAIFCVGFMGRQLGGRRVWMLPAAFILPMAAGGVVGILGVGSFPAGYIVMGSVILFGAVVAADSRVPAWLIFTAAAICGAFHGYALGQELPAGTNSAAYMFGFVISGALITAAGGWLADIAHEYRSGKVVLRVVGGIIGIAGILMTAGVL